MGTNGKVKGAGSASGFAHDDHGNLVQNMIDTLEGKGKLSIPVESVRHSLEICLAMYESDRKGGPVKLPYEGDSISG